MKYFKSSFNEYLQVANVYFSGNYFPEARLDLELKVAKLKKYIIKDYIDYITKSYDSADNFLTHEILNSFDIISDINFVKADLMIDVILNSEIKNEIKYYTLIFDNLVKAFKSDSNYYNLGRTPILITTILEILFTLPPNETINPSINRLLEIGANKNDYGYEDYLIKSLALLYRNKTKNSFAIIKNALNHPYQNVKEEANEYVEYFKNNKLVNNNNEWIG